MATRNDKHRSTKVQHPLSGSTLGNWLRLLMINDGLGAAHWQRSLGITAMILLNTPLQILETLWFSPRLRATEIAQAPIFILGHWRSGTTHLHRLMVQDPQWGYISSLQAFLPESFLITRQTLFSKLQQAWPKVRLMDNVSYSPSVPEEEEYALGNMTPYSFYTCWYFPEQMADCYRKSVLMEGLSPSDQRQWEQAFLKVLKKATVQSKGKPLVVKNPSNTAKIKLLLALFPKAKFVHIFRNPYDVYSSTMRFYEKMMPYYALQPYDMAAVEAQVFSFYRRMMERYFETAALVPANNLVEIRYEDFDGNEMSCLETIYQKLELSSFESARPAFERYLSAQAGYRKNQYSLDAETKSKIDQQWQDVIEKWSAIAI